ncbi:MAG TPA: hypothetical protein VMA35_04450 [Candidatus Sulfopaludibacter sp.]|nr:hypothetical protein [Candidatus Sulfopaludibacter sp.]
MSPNRTAERENKSSPQRPTYSIRVSFLHRQRKRRETHVRLWHHDFIYSLFFPAAFALAHLNFAALAIFALAAALILRLAFLTGFEADFRPLAFAQRALCAAAILFLPTALIFLRLLGADSLPAPSELKSLLSCFSSDWIFCFSVAALSNWLTDRFIIEFIGINNKGK